MCRLKAQNSGTRQRLHTHWQAQANAIGYCVKSVGPMGRGGPRSRGPQPSNRNKTIKPRRVQEDLPSDDEVEKFHKTKEKLSLNPAEDEASSDEDQEELDDEAVYNLSASEGSDDDDTDDEDDDEEDEDDKSRYAQRTACF